MLPVQAVSECRSGPRGIKPGHQASSFELPPKVHSILVPDDFFFIGVV